MAQSTREFLTSGPVAGNSGDITAGQAYHVIWREIGQAIAETSEKNEKNSKEIIDELKALRTHFKEIAEKNASKRISQLQSGEAKEFLDALRTIKNITEGMITKGDVKSVTRSFQGLLGPKGPTGQGIVGQGAVQAVGAIDPGLGLILKALQENRQSVKEVYGAFKSVLGGIWSGTKLLASGFKSISQFLDPSRSGNILHFLSGGLELGAGVALALIAEKLKSIGDETEKRLREEYDKAHPGRKFTDLPLTPAQQQTVDESQWLKERMRLGFDPKDPKINYGTHWYDPIYNALGIKAVPSDESQYKQPDIIPDFNKQKTRGFSPVAFNTGIANGKGDTVLELLAKQTELLSEILKVLIGGRPSGAGFIRALQAGGTVAPGGTALVGEGDGPEEIQVGGRKGAVNGPALLTAGKDPVQVTPGGGSSGGAGASGTFAQQVPIPTAGPQRGYVNPINNPNVNQEIMEKYSGRGLPAAIRMNNPGAISLSTRHGGSIGDTRPKSEGGWYTKFNTPEEGIQGEVHLLKEYGERGQDTIRKVIMGGWAAKGQAPYIEDLSKQLNMSPDAKLDFENKEVQLAFSMAQGRHEGAAQGLHGPVYSEETYRRAIYGTDPEGASRTTNIVRSYQPPFLVKPGTEDEKRAQQDYKRQQQATMAGKPQEAASVVPKAQKSSRQSSTPQQPADLNVRGNGPTAADEHRSINNLNDKAHRAQHEDHPKQATQPHSPQQRHGKRQADYSAHSTHVGVVMAATGPGLG